MDALALIRDVGVPVGLLAFASIALWRAWSLERRLREADLKGRLEKLAEREDELYALYRALALRELEALASERQDSGRIRNPEKSETAFTGCGKERCDAGD